VEIIAASGNCPNMAVQSPLLRCTKPNGYGKGMGDKEAKQITNTEVLIERKNVIRNSINDGSCSVENNVQAEVYLMYIGKQK
jgi:hypothetical protein